MVQTVGKELDKFLVITGVNKKYASVLKKLSKEEKRELASLLMQPFLEETREKVNMRLAISELIEQCEFYHEALQKQLKTMIEFNDQIKLVADKVKAKKAAKRDV